MVLSTISKLPSMMVSKETADVPFGYIIGLNKWKVISYPSYSATTSFP